MINSFHSLLYAAQPLGILSDEDLEKIESLKEQPADFIFSELRKEVQDRLNQLNWRAQWEEVVRHSEKYGLWTVSRYCPEYPSCFSNMHRPPLVLSVLGDPIWRKHRLITVVGTRHPSRSSQRWMSFHLASLLKDKGFTVVSGGARGVDQWAHRISLSVGHGTLAVVPSGLMNLYPQSLKDLAPEIISSGGSLISMYPIKSPMKKFFFHQRNHLLAAMGDATLVVEAGVKSGSLITGRHAMELSKDVYCLPFSPWEERGAGNTMLLREGAVAVASEHDILQSMEGQLSFHSL